MNRSSRPTRRAGTVSMVVVVVMACVLVAAVIGVGLPESYAIIPCSARSFAKPCLSVT